MVWSVPAPDKTGKPDAKTGDGVAVSFPTSHGNGL